MILSGHIRGLKLVVPQRRTLTGTALSITRSLEEWLTSWMPLIGTQVIISLRWRNVTLTRSAGCPHHGQPPKLNT
jgi:hypothetical protein